MLVSNMRLILSADIQREKQERGTPAPLPNYLVEEVLSGIGETHFLAVIHGDSMKNAGVLSGDTVVIKRTKVAEDNDIVLCSVSGQHLLKRIRYSDETEHGMSLHSENPEYGVMFPKELFICGVATHVIKALQVVGLILSTFI